MNAENDRQLHENLTAIGQSLSAPAAPSSQLRDRCMAILTGTPVASRWQRLRRHALMPSLAVAASVALIVGIFFSPGGSKSVDAAVVLSRLDRQISDDATLELKIANLGADDSATVDASILISDAGLLCDFKTTGRGQEQFDVEFQLAIPDADPWVLVHKLEVADEKAQAMIDAFIPHGTDTLLLLPKELLEVSELELPGANAVTKLARANMRTVIEAIQEIVRARPDIGGAIANRADGSMELRLPLKDGDVLKRLVKAVEPALEQAITSLKIEVDESDVSEFESWLDGDDNAASEDQPDKDLAGSTLVLVYEPASEHVRSLSLVDLGETGGSLSLIIHDGPIDPSRFDAASVTTPQTHRIDTKPFISLFNLQKVGKQSD